MKKIRNLFLLGMATLAGYGLSFQSNYPLEEPGTRLKANQISANPQTLVLQPGTNGTTVISWNSTFASANIYFSKNGAAPRRFASGSSGSQPATWIEAGSTYVFSLYSTNNPVNPLASVTVTGIIVNGHISANPTQVPVVPGQTGTTAVSWMTNGSNAQVYVSANGGPETLFAGGATGSQQAPWIQANSSYTFRLYAGTAHTLLLDSVTVTGVQAAGQLSASPSVVPLPPGGTGVTLLSWSLQNSPGGQIRYRVDGGSEQVFRTVTGNSGTASFNSIREGTTYQFRLTGAGSTATLASTTVTTRSTYGFADSGLVTAKVRTEFRNSQIPNLTLNPNACLYTGTNLVINPHVCNILPTTPYPAANEWQQNGGFSSPNYWVLGMNTEFDPWAVCNTGPPNMSEPNQGINFANGTANGRYGFQMRKDPAESFWRAHMFVDNRPLAPQAGCVGTNRVVPFLSLGSHSGHGNPTPVGVLNPSGNGPSATQFTAKMWDYHTKSTYVDFHVYAFTNWGGRTRGLFVRLVYEGKENDPNTEFLDRRWNWPIEESYYFPGADFAYMDALLVNEQCYEVQQLIQRMRPYPQEKLGPGEISALGQDIDYTIDWQAFFQCASRKGLFQEPLPVNLSDIPLTGVHWTVEVAGNSGTPNGGLLWMSIHDMQMIPSP